MENTELQARLVGAMRNFREARRDLEASSRAGSSEDVGEGWGALIDRGGAEEEARARLTASRTVLHEAVEALALAGTVGAPLPPGPSAAGALAAWRKRHGLTLRHAADQLGVAPSTVHLWERGRRVPRPTDRKRIEKTAGIPAGAWPPRLRPARGLAPGALGPVALRRWREAQQLGQQEAAALLDLSQATVSALERGTRSPSAEVADRVQEVTGIPSKAWTAAPEGNGGTC
ncbi:MAG: helix-turn-helix transcriptional regulator [Myxococcota bacterium]|nr:helix-turn-helix transcriptional regulator [Myxococcota bacterium]